MGIVYSSYIVRPVPRKNDKVSEYLIPKLMSSPLRVFVFTPLTTAIAYNPFSYLTRHFSYLTRHTHAYTPNTLPPT